MIVGFQNENENEHHSFGKLVVWHLKSFGRVLDFFRSVCTNPASEDKLF